MFKREKFYENLGKWLLDVAKYTLTAVIISSMLTEFGEKWKFWLAAVVTLGVTFGFGIFLSSKDNSSKKGGE